MQDASHYAGVSKRLIEIWDKERLIVVSRVVTPGHSKGRTFVDKESLDKFILSYVGKAPAKLAVNASKQGGAK